MVLCALRGHLRWALPPLPALHQFTPVMGVANTLRMVLCASPRLPCTSQEEITFPLLMYPGVWVHPSYGVRTDRPHSVWSCALSEGTCGGRCLLPALHEYPVQLWGAQIDHTPYGLVRSPRAPWALPCTSQEEITFPLLTRSMGSPQLWGAHR